MKSRQMKAIAMAIVVLELVATVSTATAQDASSQGRRIERQQRKISRQQQEIIMNQKMIEQQRRQLARSPAPTEQAPEASNSVLGGLFQCPPHYYFNWLSSHEPCLPDLNYVR